MPCIVASDLTEEQIRELALIDNKSSEIAEWDFDLLGDELSELDLSDFELDWFCATEDINNSNIEKPEENPYTMKVDIPHYEIKGECPNISELVSTEKQKELEKDIKNSNISKEKKRLSFKSISKAFGF